MATIVVGSRVSVAGLGDGVVRYIGYHKVSSPLLASNRSWKKHHRQKERPIFASDLGTNIIHYFRVALKRWLVEPVLASNSTAKQLTVTVGQSREPSEFNCFPLTSQNGTRNGNPAHYSAGTLSLEPEISACSTGFEC